MFCEVQDFYQLYSYLYKANQISTVGIHWDVFFFHLLLWLDVFHNCQKACWVKSLVWNFCSECMWSRYSTTDTLLNSKNNFFATCLIFDMFTAINFGWSLLCSVKHYWCYVHWLLFNIIMVIFCMSDKSANLNEHCCIVKSTQCPIKSSHKILEKCES